MDYRISGETEIYPISKNSISCKMEKTSSGSVELAFLANHMLVG
jgi:hypothetical protein